MILFMNVFVPGTSATPYDRGLLPNYDRVDIFKYSLASLAAFNWWTHIFIHLELDAPHQHRREELEQYIKETLPNAKVYPQRLKHQKNWQEAMSEVFSIDENFVFFICNDDHIFIDSDTNIMEKIVTRLEGMYERGTKYLGCYFSHFPELITHVCYNKPHPVLNIYDESYEVEWVNIDSIQILSKEVLKHWWFAADYGDAILVRSDGELPGMPHYRRVNLDLPIRTLVPLKEQFRHFDGYRRFYYADSPGSCNHNYCPPLTIPEGFFERDIKIAYCHQNRIPGYYHVNPMLLNHSSVDPNGADAKWMLEDMPLFWRNRVSSIDTVEVDREVLVNARNSAKWDLINAEVAFRTLNPDPITLEASRQATFIKA